MNRLESIEAEEKKTISRSARAAHRPRPWRVFLFSLLSTPFLIIEAMFVPLIGQIIVIGIALMSLAYLIATRSVREFAAGAIGITLSLIILRSLLSPHLFLSQPFIVYAFFGLCTFVSVGVFLVISGALWAHYERGRKQLQA